MRNPCCDKEGTNKGAWSKQEDLKLIDYIKANGEGCWRSLPKSAGLQRCGKSCRLRWINYLRPDIKRGNFGQDEDDLIIKLHALLGNRWSLIAGRLPGRTDNEVKNYWNSHLRKKLIKMGVDPNNHRLNKNHITAQAQLPMVDHDHHHQLKPSTALSTEKATKESSCNTSALKSSAAESKTTERVNSDAASCLEDETARHGSLDLNLDLTIAFPSHRKHMEEIKSSTQGRDNINNNQLAKEMETIGNSNIDFSSPTLILFR